MHGSDGRDLTLCVTSIAQVILNPDCRTVSGFEALIEREWLQVGIFENWKHWILKETFKKDPFGLYIEHSYSYFLGRSSVFHPNCKRTVCRQYTI